MIELLAFTIVPARREPLSYYGTWRFWLGLALLVVVEFAFMAALLAD